MYVCACVLVCVMCAFNCDFIKGPKRAPSLMAKTLFTPINDKWGYSNTLALLTYTDKTTCRVKGTNKVCVCVCVNHYISC